jgi:hypothetical protein
MIRLLALASLLLASFVGRATAEPVDLELVLAVDISGSVDEDEARLQRQGYIQAFNHPAVMAAIQSGFHKRIAATYVEWAGGHYQETLVDWTVITDPASAKRFTDEINRQPIDTAQWTSISGAIRYGMKRFSQSPHSSRRRVIDISGDGANNNGLPILGVRDQAIQAGFVINGLPIVNGKPSRFGARQIPNLDTYYRDCVIGGTGAFIVVANGFEDFARAIRRKLILEIAGIVPPPPRFIPAQFGGTNRDCLDGERWLMRQMDDF